MDPKNNAGTNPTTPKIIEAIGENTPIKAKSKNMIKEINNPTVPANTVDPTETIN